MSALFVLGIVAGFAAAWLMGIFLMGSGKALAEAGFKGAAFGALCTGSLLYFTSPIGIFGTVIYAAVVLALRQAGK